MLTTAIVARRQRIVKRFELETVLGRIARSPNLTAPIGTHRHKSDPRQKVSLASEHSTIEVND